VTVGPLPSGFVLTGGAVVVLPGSGVGVVGVGGPPVAAVAMFDCGEWLPAASKASTA
jgi:hypothetical protein